MSATKLISIGRSSLNALASALHRHPGRRLAAVVALLAGSGVTALAISPVVSGLLPPEPAVAVVHQELAMGEWANAGSLDASTPTLTLYRSALTRADDTADTLLNRLGVDDASAAEFLRNDGRVRSVLQGRVGKLVRASTNAAGLQSMVVLGPGDTSADIDTLYTRISIERLPNAGAVRFSVRKEVLPLDHQPQLASGIISSSLYAAADEARIPESVTNQLAEAFATDIDFHHELRRGDAFSVVYEANLADGQPVTWGNPAGHVLAARFVNQGHVHEAIWYAQAGDGRGAYFDAHGQSKARAFLASPLAFSRVTSGFSMRFHPILKTWKWHLGVDFGAPTGTPVRCVGEGVVSFAGQQTGYGNVVQIQHGPNRSTVYAHLSRIDVRRGQHVEQGQRLGAVGATGWATGPHLHFEFKVDGKQVDPMTIARASERMSLPESAKAAFARTAAQSLQRLDLATGALPHQAGQAQNDQVAMAHFE